MFFCAAWQGVLTWMTWGVCSLGSLGRTPIDITLPWRGGLAVLSLLWPVTSRYWKRDESYNYNNSYNCRYTYKYKCKYEYKYEYENEYMYNYKHK